MFQRPWVSLSDSRNRGPIALILVVLLVAAGVAGYLWWKKRTPSVSPTPPDTGFTPTTTLKKPRGPLNDLIFAPDGKQLFCVKGGTIELWDIDKDQLVRSRDLSRGRESSVASWSRGTLLKRRRALEKARGVLAAIPAGLLPVLVPLVVKVEALERAQAPSGEKAREALRNAGVALTQTPSQPFAFHPALVLHLDRFSPLAEMDTVMSVRIPGPVRFAPTPKGPKFVAFRSESAWFMDRPDTVASLDTAHWERKEYRVYGYGFRVIHFSDDETVSFESGVRGSGDSPRCLGSTPDGKCWLLVRPNGELTWYEYLDFGRFASPTPTTLKLTGLKGKRLGQILQDPPPDYGFIALLGGQGKRVLLREEDSKKLAIWDLEGQRICHLEVKGLQGLPLTVAVSRDGNRLYFPVQDGEMAVGVWDTQTGKEIRRFEERSGFPLALSHGSQRLACRSGENTVLVWDVAQGEVLHRLRCESRLKELAISDDGKRVAVGTGEGTIHIWDLPE